MQYRLNFTFSEGERRTLRDENVGGDGLRINQVDLPGGIRIHVYYSNRFAASQMIGVTEEIYRIGIDCHYGQTRHITVGSGRHQQTVSYTHNSDGEGM